MARVREEWAELQVRMGTIWGCDGTAWRGSKLLLSAEIRAKARGRPSL